MAISEEQKSPIFASLETLPLAERARREILQAILEGKFDQRLPSEDVLASMLSVSRTTVRSALQGLEQEGIVTRRRAIGTTLNRNVSASSLALQRLVGFDWLLREQGHEVKIEASFRRGDPPADLQTRFDLTSVGECLLTAKQYLASGTLALSVRDVVPVANLRTDAPEDPPPSMFEFSRLYCNQPIDHAVVQIAAAVNGRDQTNLPLSDGDPFTRLYEIHYSVNADVVAYTVIDVDDRFIRLEVFRRETQ